MKVFISFLFGFIVIHSSCQTSLKSHKEVLLLMGTRFEITALADEKEIAKKAVEESILEIQRIEALISSWQADSQTSLINQNAGVKPVIVDEELFRLIERALKISKITSGAFDISFAGIDKIYKFDKTVQEIPTQKELSKSVQKIDFNKIELDQTDFSVFLQEEGMKIGFGGIGKGYAANRAKMIMSKIEGVKGGLVNAAGDLLAWGENGKENGWPIQISDPTDISNIIGYLEIQDMSVVTSGDYEKYFMNKGIRYSHIINPETGIPTTGIKSATVICPDAEVGDAIATSLFIKGHVEAIRFIDGLRNIEALIITDENKVLTSRNLKLKKY